MKININDKEIELKYSFRGYIIYESIMGKSFQSNGMTEMIVLFYSMLLATDPSFINDFDKFVAYIDENPQALSEFSQWLVAVLKQQHEIRGVADISEKEVEAIDPKN